MRFILLLLIVLFYSFQLKAVNDKVSIRQAINISIHQKALTQRIAKVYLALNNNPQEPSFYQERDYAIEQFQSHLNALRWYTPTDEVKQSIQQMRELWKDYKAVADWSINKEGAIQLLGLSDEMLKISTQLSNAYLNYARSLEIKSMSSKETKSIIVLIKNAGTQRMLTQRIMLHHLAIKEGINAKTSTNELSTAITNYKQLLDAAITSPVNTPAIKKKLEKIAKSWAILSKSVNNFKLDNQQLKALLDTANDLFKEADLLSLLYQKLGVKLSISHAINMVNYQNMLIQRMAKAYLALSQSHATAKHRRELMSSIDLFEDQMLSMIRFVKDTEHFEEAINVVRTMWKNYHNLITNWEKMDELSIIKVLESAHIMMATCDHVGLKIQAYAKTIPDYETLFVQNNGTPIPNEANVAYQMQLAGWQRASTQRLAIYAIMNALNLDAQLSKRRMEDILNQYKKNNTFLINSSVKSKSIQTNLDLAQQKWKAIEPYLRKSQKKDIEQILTLSHELFISLDKLNESYQEYMDLLFIDKE